MRRWLAALVVLWAAASAPAQHLTTNFNVIGPPELRRQIGAAAEEFRRSFALRWYGRELSPWAQRCPLHVIEEWPHISGVTYPSGSAPRQIVIRGPAERMASTVLAHEVHHAVMLAVFPGGSLPRWADEGLAVLAEDEHERERYEQKCDEILMDLTRRVTLRELFAVKQYRELNDRMALYAQGQSLSRYLLDRGDQVHYFNFVKKSAVDPDAAARMYGFSTCDRLEEAWLKWRKAERGHLDVMTGKSPPLEDIHPAAAALSPPLVLKQ